MTPEQIASSPAKPLHRPYEELIVEHPSDWYGQMIREYVANTETLVREKLPDVRSIVFGCPDNPEAWVLHGRSSGTGLQATLVSGTQPLELIDSVFLPSWAEHILIAGLRCGYGGEWRLDPYHIILAGKDDYYDRSSQIALLGRLALVTQERCHVFPGWQSDAYGPWTMMQTFRLDYRISNAEMRSGNLILTDAVGTQHSIAIDCDRHSSTPVGLRKLPDPPRST